MTCSLIRRRYALLILLSIPSINLLILNYSLLTVVSAGERLPYQSIQHEPSKAPPLGEVNRPRYQPPAHLFEDNRPREAWVVRIYFSEPGQATRLAVEHDLWSVDHQAGYAVALVSEHEWESLIAEDYIVHIDREQTQRLLEIGALSRQATAAMMTQEIDGNGTIPGFPCYRTVEKTYADLASLATAHPQLARWIDVGDSWDKITEDGPPGYDIQVLVLTNQKISLPKPKLFIVSAVHARELATAETVARFAERLVAHYGEDPDVTWLLDHSEIHLLPIGNPDGRKWAEQLIYWRKNANQIDGVCVGEPSVFRHGGVDLNRNSSFKWNECDGFNCSSSNGCAQTYRGTGAASEPETQALQAYMSSIFSDTRDSSVDAAAPLHTTGLMLTVHSYGELVIFPWGWSNDPSPNDKMLATLGRKFGHITGYGVCQSGSTNCLYQADGLNDDWAYGELGVPAYTFELGTEFFESCTYYDDHIVDIAHQAFIYGAKAARLPYQLPAGPVVTDIHVSAHGASPRTVVIGATVDDTQSNSNGPWGVEPRQVISAARFTIDAPSWVTSTQVYTLTEIDGVLDDPVESFSYTLPIDGWAGGRHTIYIEGQDADGNWGVVESSFITVPHVRFYPIITMPGVDQTGP